MNISQQQIAAIAQKILTEYQTAVDAELMSCLNKDNFDYLFASRTLSEIYQRHYGRLYGLLDLLSLESAPYFSPLKETVRAVIEQLLEQSTLNGRVLLDISEARRHGKDAQTASPLPLTLVKTELPELIAEGVIVPSLPEKACLPVPGDKPVQQAAKTPYLICEHGNYFTLPGAFIFQVGGKEHQASVGGLFCEIGFPVMGVSQ